MPYDSFPKTDPLAQRDGSGTTSGRASLSAKRPRPPSRERLRFSSPSPDAPITTRGRTRRHPAPSTRGPARSPLVSRQASPTYGRDGSGSDLAALARWEPWRPRAGPLGDRHAREAPRPVRDGAPGRIATVTDLFSAGRNQTSPAWDRGGHVLTAPACGPGHEGRPAAGGAALDACPQRSRHIWPSVFPSVTLCQRPVTLRQ